MPLTKKGKQLLEKFKAQYGNEEGERVFYASQKKGTIKGTHRNKYKRSKRK